MIVRLLLLAFLFLGCGPSPEEVPALVEGLRSPKSSVRNESALKLGRIGAPYAERAVPALVNLLSDENPGVQSAAAFALRKIDTQEARTALDRARKKFGK